MFEKQNKEWSNDNLKVEAESDFLKNAAGTAFYNLGIG